MTRILLFAGNELVGWADLTPTDPSMGGVSGVFHPTDAYQRIQPVIWNTIRYSDYTNSSTPEGIAAFRAKDALALRVCTEAGESLEQVGPIWLADFTDQFSDIEIELDVAGVPWWVLKRVFGWVGTKNNE